MSTESDFPDEFSLTAERYAAVRPMYPRALFETLASLSPSTQSAWDCGTGNGQAAIGIAEFFDSVEATDASAEQIGHAQPHPRVRYRTAAAEASGLAEGSMDLVSVAQALHWFDIDRFFCEVRRVARPRAVLAIYGYSWFYLTPALDALTDRWLLRPVQPYWLANNRLLWDGYRTIALPFEQLASPSLAIHLTWTLEQLFEYFLTWSAPRRKIAAEGDGFVSAARHALKSAWGDASQRRHVVMPLSVRVGRLP